MKAVAVANGFEYALFGIEMRRPFLEPIQHVTNCYPEAYWEIYCGKNFVSRDPVFAHCRNRTNSLIWCEDLYSANSHEIREESTKYGLGHGLSVSVTDGPYMFSMLSLARDKPFETAAEKKRVLTAGVLLVDTLHVVSKNLIVPEMERDLRPNLTPREQECLKWIAEGKSNSVIGDLLKLSEATVDFHIRNIFRKLNVASRTQACVVAMSMGLIG